MTTCHQKRANLGANAGLMLGSNGRSKNADQKTYSVKWEGTLVYRETQDNAIRDLWIARMTLAQCSISNPRDPGETHAKNLALSAFEDVKPAIKKEVLNYLAGHYLENVQDLVEQLIGEKPAEENDIYGRRITIRGVECWCDARFILGAPRSFFDITDEEGNSLFASQIDRVVAIKMATLAFENRATDVLSGKVLIKQLLALAD